MEEKDVIKNLNWCYYGIMVFTLILLTVSYYAFFKGLYEPLDPQGELGCIVQYVVIIMALVTIPGGLYIIKFFKPKTLEKYQQLATIRISTVSSTMPLGIVAYYWMGCYQSMLWVAAIAAIAWYFSKPTLGKLQQEMKPEDPGQETY